LLVSFDIFFGADILEDILFVHCWQLSEPHVHNSFCFWRRGFPCPFLFNENITSDARSVAFGAKITTADWCRDFWYIWYL